MRYVCDRLRLSASHLLHLTPRLPRKEPPVLFEGARLISSDGSAPVENSAFIVENAKFTKVGKEGRKSMRPRAGAGARGSLRQKQ